MDVHLVSILGTLVALVAVVSLEFHARTKGDRRNLFGQRIAVYAIFLLSTAATGVAWTRYPAYGVVHGLTTYGAIAVILIERFTRVRIVQPLVIFSILLAFVFFIVMIPIVALPLFKSSVFTDVPYTQPAEDIDMTFLERSLGNIQESLTTVRTSIDAEASKIEDSISMLTSQLDEKRRELKQLNSEVARLSGEVERYKNLASLTEIQVQAIKAQLEKMKYIDYVVGFLIGLLSSLIVAFLYRFIESLNRSAASDEAGGEG